ncbi:hypothetical protein VOI54_17570 [Tamlana sp. 2201CG12-4]|uniref:CBM96 family carbohydrate-binding protein n=1 Tax=Tamlana sp. 2201CG12-4 TaxID=3112582 RepID=UPI002DB9F57D|nr:hypothetical protein [Tamlana sp. 2201CG12-4]MEC3908841.1 hypothetical protein [Tamlana sp. 2201CG12-4]
MKALLYIITSISVLVVPVQAQKNKIKVSEDTYIEAGLSARIPMGEKDSKNIKVFKSEGTDKQSRTGLLKFKIPGHIKSYKRVSLYLYVLVNRKDHIPNAMFNLNVFGVQNDEWSELKIIWDDRIKTGSLLGTKSIPQSFNKKRELVKIRLKIGAFKKLIDKNRDTIVSLALANTEFNKINAVISTKERSMKQAAYLVIE